MLIAYGNLRGMKESGKLFAVPTYFFIVNMFVLLGVGIVARCHVGSLPQGATSGVEDMVPLGTHHGNGLFMGATVFVVLQGVRLGRRGRDRRRGDLQRRARVPAAGVEERPHDAGHHGLAARRHVPRPVDARRAHTRDAVRRRHADGDLAGRQVRLRRDRCGHVLFYACRPARC